jgi:coenzyme F420-reducing hydrogenase delta subunit/Fe-S-cluster-containing hydrogenase component 2
MSPEILLIRLMCAGRVDMTFVLGAFQKDAEGVIIGSCWLGQCHYITEGNYDALSMVQLCEKLLEHRGVSPERLRIESMSAAEGVRFAEAMNDFTEKLRELGPVSNGNGGLAPELEAVAKLAPYIKLVKKDELARRLDNEEDYDELYTRDEIDTLFREVVSCYVDPEKCRACLVCGRQCPVEGIAGGKNQIHIIDQESCIGCGTCFDACPTRFDAVRKIVGEPVPPPIPRERRTIVRKSKESSKGA